MGTMFGITDLFPLESVLCSPAILFSPKTSERQHGIDLSEYQQISASFNVQFI